METLASIIESILFVSGDAVSVRDIAEKLCLPDKQIMEEAEKLQMKTAVFICLYSIRNCNSARTKTTPTALPRF